jgi:hypothetical protein
MSDAAAKFGTLSWATAGGGAMTARESAREIAHGVLVLLRAAPARVRQLLGLRNPRVLDYDVDRLPTPDSRIARQAEALCREASPARLFHHSQRTYAWGMILAEHDGLRPDAELLYVASLLHDLALTDRFRHYAAMPCFGARAAMLGGDWAQKQGWPEARCRTLADAISLHLNVAVSPEHGPEAQLLQAGAALDVIGLRHWDIAPRTVDAVLRRHPRYDMKRASYPDFAAEAHPGTRARLLHRWLLFGPLVRHAPFDE